MWYVCKLTYACLYFVCMIFGESVQNRMFLIIVEGGWGFPSVSCDLIYFVLITITYYLFLIRK